MNSSAHIKTLPLLLLAAVLCLPELVAANSSPQKNTSNQVKQNDNATMYLGKVEVHGEANIVKTLQAIKVGLEQLYSNDPKLANVVVCRLQDQAGSHIRQWLICGTNRTLSQQRAALHIAMDAAVTAGSSVGESATCMSSACYAQVFAVLNETLNSLSGHYLQTGVNGSALHGLLEKIPYPEVYTKSKAPPPATTTAPAATTHY